MKDSFDILVVGAGPAGIAAAVSAAACGKRVGLVDDNPAAGGQIWRSGGEVPDDAQRWIAMLEASSVARLQGWRVFDAPRSGVLHAERGDGECGELCYKNLILATGARERFLPFPGWTLPNVMGAGGLDALVRGGVPIAGKRVVVAGTGPLLLAVAAHLKRHGARIVAVCEQAPLSRLVRFASRLLGEPAKLRQGAEYRIAIRGARYLTGCWIVAAHGRDRVESVRLRQGSKQWDVACDFVGCGFHLVPNIELPALLGCRIDHGFVSVDDSMQTSVPGVYCVGEPTGIGGVELAVLEGEIAGRAAAGRADEARKHAQRRRGKLGFLRALQEVCTLDPQLRSLPTADTRICRCEDVRLVTLDGHNTWRDAKLQTRCGMGPCQGRVCGPATEFLFGWRVESVRPPIFPALVSSLGSACEADGLQQNSAPQGASPAFEKETL